MCPRGGRWVNGDAALWGTGRMVCHVLAIETDRSGIVLVDSGIGLADVHDAKRRLGRTFVAATGARLDENETALRRVEKLGFDASDVRHIVLTHMDLDHASGLPDFPKAKVHVHKTEHHAATVKPTFAERERYKSVQWKHGPDFETYEPNGEEWNGFECVRALRGLPPEILLVPTIGHTRGHSAVAIENGDRWLLHAGDAYFHAGQLDREKPHCTPLLSFFQSLVAVDRPNMRKNQARLRELALSGKARVFCAHDPSELDALQAESKARSERPRATA
jgi:glyoxylase-like metal-dependent hydrolase (beta-lactamase superfamily II)